MKSFKQYITELFEKPYKWTLRDKHSRETVPNLGTQDVRYYFKTDDGKTMAVRFSNRMLNDKYITTVGFFDDNASGPRYKMTHTGDAMKIMSTVLDIIKDSIKNVGYDEIHFSAGKQEGGEKTGRIKLYKAMVKRFASKLGYKVKNIKEQDVDFTFTLEKK